MYWVGLCQTFTSIHSFSLSKTLKSRYYLILKVSKLKSSKSMDATRLFRWFLAGPAGLYAGWIWGPIVGSPPLFRPPSQQSALPAFLSTFTKHLCVSYHQNVILKLQTDLKVNRNITFWRHTWSQKTYILPSDWHLQKQAEARKHGF